MGLICRQRNELIANNRTIEQVEELIGADRLIYQDLRDLISSASEGNPQITEFDTSCFSNKYITGDVSNDYLSSLEARRSDDAKKRKIEKPSRLRDVSNV